MPKAKRVRLHPHALTRLAERGATRKEITGTVQKGERFPAKFGRTGFRRNFVFKGKWHGHEYSTKQLEVYAVEEKKHEWLVITVIVKYF